MSKLPCHRIVGSRLTEIGHSKYTRPEFILEGIGPATFRSHFLRLDSGVVLDLFTAEITLSDVSSFPMKGETDGIHVADLVGRTITHLWRDDVMSSLVILDNELYLCDANDGCYGNPLRAGVVADDYSADELKEFTDYWTEGPLH